MEPADQSRTLDDLEGVSHLRDIYGQVVRITSYDRNDQRVRVDFEDGDVLIKDRHLAKHTHVNIPNIA